MKKVLFTATVDSHILAFHIPYLKMFKEEGYEVHVATNGQENIPYCDKKHIVCFERSPFKINNLKAIKQLKKIIENEHYDIIHCHTPMGSVVTRLAAKKARRNGTRVIYTAHGFHFYKGAPILNWLLFYPVEKWLSRYTDDLITINKEDYELAKRKMKAKRIHYVPGVGIDEEKFNFVMTKEEKIQYRKSLGLKENDFVMIFPARLDKNKNQGLLIKAMALLVKDYENIHLLLPGEDELNGYYQNMTKELNLEKSIHFLGYRNDIPQLIKISNLAVSTSLREGLGLNLIEAIASNVPVIATHIRGHVEIVQNSINGNFINNNISSIYSEICNYYKRRHKYSISYTVKKYYLENVVYKFKKIYDL